MRVVPVLDVLGGVVVRGVGGRRQEYRPVVSRLTPSSAPLDVARALAAHFGLRELYVADLDAIAGAAPARDVYAALKAGGFRLWVDAGVRVAEDALALAAAGVDTVVAGLETLAGPGALAEAAARLGERLVFSLDLRAGVPLAGGGVWDSDPWRIAQEAIERGVRRVLVLDLARVGVGAGVGTEALCARLAAAHPEVEVSAGGGVRGRGDLLALKGAGVRAALVASALHDGRLTVEQLEGL
jgi:phosphoribosylformimino-5-aminoimidazole carboxamide ribotide isomerase